MQFVQWLIFVNFHVIVIFLAIFKAVNCVNDLDVDKDITSTNSKHNKSRKHFEKFEDPYKGPPPVYYK